MAQNINKTADETLRDKAQKINETAEALYDRYIAEQGLGHKRPTNFAKQDALAREIVHFIADISNDDPMNFLLIRNGETRVRLAGFMSEVDGAWNLIPDADVRALLAKWSGDYDLAVSFIREVNDPIAKTMLIEDLVVEILSDDAMDADKITRHESKDTTSIGQEWRQMVVSLFEAIEKPVPRETDHEKEFADSVGFSPDIVLTLISEYKKTLAEMPDDERECYARDTITSSPYGNNKFIRDVLIQFVLPVKNPSSPSNPKKDFH